MEYNTSRPKLVISEYGRHVQKMIDHALTVKDRDKRTKLAHHIVNIMAILKSQNKDSNDFKQKLWDHMFLISDFKLEVDSPFPKPEKTRFEKKPDPVKYPENNIKYRHYGRNMFNIIQKASEKEDGPEKEMLVKRIANHLKKSYVYWNKEPINDEIIAAHLYEISNHKLSLDSDVKLDNTSDILQAKPRKKRQKGHSRNKKRSS